MKKFTFPTLLQATPFEYGNNLDGFLSEDRFFSELHVKTKEIDSVTQQIVNTIKNKRNILAIFLEGYRGTGKTTLLHNLDRHNPDFVSTFINFHPSKVEKPNPTTSLVEDKEIEVKKLRDVGDDPISMTIKTYVRKLDEAEKNAFASFLRVNNQLYKYFGRCGVNIQRLRYEKDIAKEILFNEILNEASFEDILVLFFLLIVRREILYREKHGRRDKFYLIIFDNLDAVDIAYLTPFFRDGFTSAREEFAEIYQKSGVFSERDKEFIDFSNKFKFIFCLRDSNNALMNAHRDDRLRLISTDIKMGNFECELYDRALQKRIDFFNSQKCENQCKQNEIVEILREFSQDEFFGHIILPLYNWNFRLSTSSLYTALEEIIELPSELQSLDIKSKSDDFGFQYGKRAAIFYYVVKKLQNRDFLGEYPLAINKSVLEEEGYCVPLRVMLTFILNNSGSITFDDFVNQRKPFKNVGLRKLFEGLKDILSDEEIANTLFDMFDVHRNNWEHFITFRNTAINENKEEFTRDLLKLTVQNKRKELDNYEITLNPSGLSCVKNLLVHFECYSVLFKAGKRPLFLLGLKPGKDYAYEFEDVINKVFLKVEEHCSYMRTRFRTVFEEKKGMTQKAFLRSPYAFKHFEKKTNPEGLFHATRVAIFHINYIDRFRLWILEKERDRENKQRINKSLVGFIERYSDILHQWEGLEKVKQDISFEIAKLKEGNFTDFKHQINKIYK